MSTPAPRVTFVIKNSQRPGDSLSLDVSPDATVDDLRQLIQDGFHGNPPPSEQTVRFKVVRSWKA